MGSAQTAPDRNLEGQIVIITGANSGLGLETARKLASCHATIILACRSYDRTQAILEELQKSYGKDKAYFLELDLSDLDSVQKFVNAFKQQFNQLHILINNAGLMIKERKLSKQGFELTLASNHIGHFALTKGLLDLITKTPQSRVINVSSSLHAANPMMAGTGQMYFDDINFTSNYSDWVSYSQSKLANVLFSKQLNRYFEENRIQSKSVSLDPGAVQTGFQNDFGCLKCMASCCFKSARDGAQTSVHCALLEFSQLKGGAHYLDCAEIQSSVNSNNVEDAKRLWKMTEDMIKKAGYNF